MNQPRRASPELIALVALWALLHIPALFSHQPWHFDELRYLEVARQMGEYGNWLVPHINAEVYTEKPPFFFWCVVLVQRVVRDYLVAGHLTVALALLASALLTMHLGRLLFGSARIGAFGGGLMLTFFFVHDIGTRVLLDPFFIALTTAGTVALLRAAITETWRARLGWTALAALATAASCMTKGPVGIAVIAIAAVALGVVWRGRKGISVVAVLAAAAVGGALTLLWVYLAALEAGWWYFERMVFRQTVGRAVQSWAHQKPWWMYVANLPRMLLPWIVLLPAAIWGAWRSRRAHGGRAGLGLAAWFTATIVFFSFMSGKRMGYLAPIYPALGLFIAWGVSRHVLLPANLPRKLLADVPQLVVTALPFVGALLALALAMLPWLPLENSMPGDSQAAWFALPGVTTPIAAGFAVLLAGAGGYFTRLHEPVERALCAGLFTVAALAALAHATLYPAFDRQYTAEPLAQYLRANKPDDETMVFLNDHKDGRFNYYLNVRGHEVLRARELDERADQPGRLWVAAYSKQWKDDVKPPARDRFELKFEYQWAGSTVQIWAEK